MRLTVVSVAYSLAPVGPDAVGGSEQVLTALDRALVDAGHRSVVVACEGSVVAGELRSYLAHDPGRPIDDAFHQARQADVRRILDRITATEPVDLIHMHGLDFHHVLPAPGPPVLVTLHLPPDWYPSAALAPTRPNTWLQCVSQSQMSAAPTSPCMLPPIPNGVATAQFGEARPRRGSAFLVLARICPEKGVHLALDAAHAAHVPLTVAGEVFGYTAHQRYFDEEIAPRLDRLRRYVGPAGFQQKRRLLARARGLLIPSLCAETSSLVAMEAASCGTPVIAFRQGALPELVEPGRTGFIVDDVAGMVAAINRVGAIDANMCRVVARARFSVDRMTALHLERYRVLATTRASRAA